MAEEAPSARVDVIRIWLSNQGRKLGHCMILPSLNPVEMRRYQSLLSDCRRHSIQCSANYTRDAKRPDEEKQLIKCAHRKIVLLRGCSFVAHEFSVSSHDKCCSDRRQCRVPQIPFKLNSIFIKWMYYFFPIFSNISITLLIKLTFHYF